MYVSRNRWMVKIADRTLYLSKSAMSDLELALTDKSVETVELDGILFKKNQFKYAVEEKELKVMSVEEQEHEHKRVMIYDRDGNKVSLYDFEKREREQELEYAKPIIEDIKAKKELTSEKFLEEISQKYSPTHPESLKTTLTEDQKRELNDIYVKIWRIRESDIDYRTKIVKEFYWRGRLRKLFVPIVTKNSERLETEMRKLSLID